MVMRLQARERRLLRKGAAINHMRMPATITAR